MGVLKGSSLATLLGDLRQKFAPKIGPVYSVNSEEPDSGGNVRLDMVPYAGNLYATDTNIVEDMFTPPIRATGGNYGVRGPRAWLLKIFGDMRHDSYDPGFEDYLVHYPYGTPEEDKPTVSIDWDTLKRVHPPFQYFVARYQAPAEGEDPEWNLDLATYGITIDGTPVVDMYIQGSYMDEDRGVITPLKLTDFRSTGWNLYNPVINAARVTKYSNTYGYRISGTYNSLYFATTLDGTRSRITVTNGAFNVTQDGYVIVSQAGADTQIWMTWSDWTSADLANGGEYEGYTEDAIDLSDIMDTYFPNGMMRLRRSEDTDEYVADEIDFNTKRIICRIERLDYSAENLAIAEASGRAYKADRNYIYLERAEPLISNEAALNGEYACDDHGMEIIGMERKMTPGTEILYSENLKDKLRRDVVTVRPQTWTAAEKQRARENIGAIGTDGLIRASAPIVVPSTSTHVVYTCDDLTTDYVLIDWGANGVSDTAELSCTIQNHKFTLWTYSANIGGTVQPVFAKATAVTFTAGS